MIEDYGLSLNMIGRWKRESKLKSGYFLKKKDISLKVQEIKALNKELKKLTMECDILKGGEHLFQERLIRYQFI
jgi:transposase|tara:strand:- start:832 stop:1053 length:222 start_codon:yes stop_codon:yes gene_type:complete